MWVSWLRYENYRKNAPHRILSIKMRGKSFSFDPIKEKQTVYPVIINRIEVWHKRFVHFYHVTAEYAIKEVGSWLTSLKILNYKVVMIVNVENKQGSLQTSNLESCAIESHKFGQTSKNLRHLYIWFHHNVLDFIACLVKLI